MIVSNIIGDMAGTQFIVIHLYFVNGKNKRFIVW